ncbi:acetylglutamate kinase [Bacillus sp. ISL-47]|uniref:acetylglutamate kinase n=1 Tax=Bacillus sp. ISL-47 TaxID=2819130 RepID=UPI001BE59F78|nr:acetylglutamate kinase [Bacillus sp. ISL-47]MBT2689023.1 acetylglutamate kinase [Bacillus sp. ISL-47]MBT2708697.1 acetylglutamate kinase [Pseudomonas sp. ISL-84]
MKSIVIKCGGSVMEELGDSFFKSLSELKNQGYQLVFVHGGGPAINKMLDLYQVPHEFINGLRKTTSEVMEVAEMVLAGDSNRKLTAMLEKHGFKAFGVSGSDGGLFKGEFLDQEKLGMVGEITSVNRSVLEMLFSEDLVPVITPIAAAKDGTKLNVNADYAAAAVASAIHAEHCIFVTDVKGIFIDGKISPHLDTEEIEQHIKDEKITGGMIPKVTSAMKAISKGLNSVMIVSGKDKFYENGSWVGTNVSAKMEVFK